MSESTLLVTRRVSKVNQIPSPHSLYKVIGVEEQIQFMGGKGTRKDIS